MKKCYKNFETAWKEQILELTEVQKGLENIKGLESILKEIVKENFQNLEKDTTVRVQEGHRLSIRFNLTKTQDIL